MTDNLLMLGVGIKFANIGLQYNTGARGSKAKLISYSRQSISLKRQQGGPYMSHDMRLPAMWYVRQAKAQTSMRIRTV